MGLLVVGGGALLALNMMNQAPPSSSAASPDRAPVDREPVDEPTVAPSEPSESPSPSPSVPSATPAPEAPITGTVLTNLRKGANIRSGPSVSASRTGGLNENESVTIQCFVWGQTVTDRLGTTDAWYRIPQGYVSAAIVSVDGSRVVPSC